MIKYLIQKEFLQIRRNSFLPRLIIVFPIVIMCVMPWVMNQEVKNIRVDVVDNDRSQTSALLVNRIAASQYFVFGGVRSSYDAALRSVEAGRTDIILEIPQGYGVKLATGEQASLYVAANAVNGTKGAIGSGYVSQIVLAGGDDDVSLLQSKFSTLFLYNKHLSYKVFMIPALFAIVVMLMCGFLPALNIVGEKESGTIEQINVTPVGKWAFILSKLIPYWLIALFVITVCIVLAQLVYGISSAGHVVWIYVLAMLLALFFSSLGLIVSNYSDTLRQAVFVMWFFVVCLMLMSGLFTPVNSMPHWAYTTAFVNPMHHFIDAVRTVFVRGGGFAQIRSQVLILAGIGALMAVWAVASYRKNI